MLEKLEIERSTKPGGVVLTLAGRIDSYWSNQLTTVLSEEIHSGQYHISLNLAGIRFISSAGVRVLLQFYKELANLNGSLIIERPSQTVVSVLEMVGLAQLLAAAPKTEVEESRESEPQRFGNVVCSLRAVGNSCLRVSLLGDPARLTSGGYTEQDCKLERFPGNRVGIGLGAIGQGFADCRNRFGEYIAVAGAAAYLPTDGTNRPDYLVQSGSLVPELSVVYGISLDGSFAHLMRFEAAETGSGLTLSEVMDAASQASAADPIGVVMLAEASGVVGAALAKSPLALHAGSSPFSFPEVRDCMNFTTERAFSRSLVLVAGIVSRQPSAPLAKLTRRMLRKRDLHGHFHAAIFPHRPLKKGLEQLGDIVKILFEAEQIQSVLHLLNDDRELIGVGESEFSRGTCWIGPVGEVVEEK